MGQDSGRDFPMDSLKGSLQAFQPREGKGPQPSLPTRKWPMKEVTYAPTRYSPKPASWDEREDGGAVLPTIGLTTAGDPGPRSIRLSSVTSFSTCQSIRWQWAPEPVCASL